LSGIVLQQAPVIYETHPDGLPHVASSIKHIAELAAAGAKTYPIRHLATEITRNVPSKQTRAELAAIYRWVRDNIRYRKDPLGLEWIQSPERTLTEGAGDCDDITAVISALAQAVGNPVKYRTAGPSAAVQKHVFPVVWDGTTWLSIDPVLEPARNTTEPRRDLGRFGQVAPGAGHLWSNRGDMLHGSDDSKAARLWDTTPAYFSDGEPIIPSLIYRSENTRGEMSGWFGDLVKGAASFIPGAGPIISTAVDVVEDVTGSKSKGSAPAGAPAAPGKAPAAAAPAAAATRAQPITVSPDITIRLQGLGAMMRPPSTLRTAIKSASAPGTQSLIRKVIAAGPKGIPVSELIKPAAAKPAAKPAARPAAAAAAEPIDVNPHISIEVPRDLDRAKAQADQIARQAEQLAVYRAAAIGTKKEATALRTAGKRATKRLVLTTKSRAKLAKSATRAIAVNKILTNRIKAAKQKAAAVKAVAWKRPHTAAALRYPTDARQVFDRATGRFHVFLPDAGQLGALRPQFSLTLGATDPRLANLTAITAAARDAWITAKNYMKAHPKESGPPNAIWEVTQFQIKDGTLVTDGLYGNSVRAALSYYLKAAIETLPPVALKWRSLPVTWKAPTAAAPAKPAAAKPAAAKPAAAKPAALPADTRSSRLETIRAAAKAALFAVSDYNGKHPKESGPPIAIYEVRKFQTADGTLLVDGLYGTNARAAMAWYLLRSDLSTMPRMYTPWRILPVTWKPPAAAAPAKVITFTEPERVIVQRPAAAAKVAPPVKRPAATAAKVAPPVKMTGGATQPLWTQLPKEEIAKLPRKKMNGYTVVVPPSDTEIKKIIAARKIAPPVKRPAARKILVKRPAATPPTKVAKVAQKIKIVRQTVRQVVRQGLPIARAAGLLPAGPLRVRPGVVVGQITRDPGGRIRVSGYVEVGQESANPGIAPVGYDMPRTQAAGAAGAGKGLFPLLALYAAANYFG
jgi:hypothetical protein